MGNCGSASASAASSFASSSGNSCAASWVAACTAEDVADFAGGGGPAPSSSESDSCSDMLEESSALEGPATGIFESKYVRV